MALPLPIHYRLDKLVDLADDANSNRAEIIAMLIAQAPFDESEMEARILAYRKMSVGDAVRDVDDTDGDDVVVPMHGPGRRKKDQAS
ncbi:MAG TPA: hypothetical protein VIC06_06775 [Solirubrobacteraceae bacterium]|jgi:hypothetical protein